MVPKSSKSLKKRQGNKISKTWAAGYVQRKETKCSQSPGLAITEQKEELLEEGLVTWQKNQA